MLCLILFQLHASNQLFLLLFWMPARSSSFRVSEEEAAGSYSRCEERFLIRKAQRLPFYEGILCLINVHLLLSLCCPFRLVLSYVYGSLTC